MTPRNLSLRPALVLCAGLLAACRGAAYWQDRLQSDPLYQRAQKLREGASCGKLVPMEFGQTLPVPVRAGGRFKVLFYPLVSSPGKATALSPAYEGTFARVGAESDVCAPLAGATPSPRGPAVPQGLSQSNYYRAESNLFAALDKTAALYAKGDPLLDAEKKDLRDYADSLLTVAEPGLLADYYRVNPEFWEWLRRECGRSIPKA
jgi:hypothetical protein